MAVGTCIQILSIITWSWYFIQAVEFINFYLPLKNTIKYLVLTKKYSYDEIKHFLFKLKTNTFKPESIGVYYTNKVVKYLDELFTLLGVKL